jgi:uncharacterized protein (UPF0248 family)
MFEERDATPASVASKEEEMNHRGAEGAEITEEIRDGPDGDGREITHGVIGAAIEVHRVLGPRRARGRRGSRRRGRAFG